MPKQRVRAMLNGRETLIEVDVPNRFPSHSASEHAARVTEAVRQRMTSLHITEWSEGFATEASTKDANALSTLLRSRRDSGHGSLGDVLSFRIGRRKKRQKYPRP